MIDLSTTKKTAYLAAVHRKDQDLHFTLESLKELAALADTLGVKVMGETYQSRTSPDSRSYLGSGKLDEIKEIIEEEEIAMVIFDSELSPNQGKFLEEQLDCLVMDRTQVILEIFTNHAQTPESRQQVELAQMKYMLPRLVGMWAHLDREKGGIGTSRGMGEKQINVDRNLIRKRISRLEKTLEKVEEERRTQAKKRKDHFTVSLVGYTNAGKTTLMDQLTGAGLGGENKLFATLESTTRVLHKLVKPDILLSDTVGFIQNLPHNLVASFRSTLSVVLEADLLLHVVDASSKMMEQQIQTTNKVLKEIKADKIPKIIIINKADLIEDKVERIILKKTFPNAVFVSNLEPTTILDLRQKMKNFFFEGFEEHNVTLTYEEAGLINEFYELSVIESIKYQEDQIEIGFAATPVNAKYLLELAKRTPEPKSES